MEKLKEASGRWGPAVGVLLQLLVILIAVPVVQDVRSHAARLATIEERLAAEPKIHDLITEQTKGWTREQLGLALAEIHKELKEIRKEMMRIP